MNKNTSLNIYLSEKELKKVEEAEKHSVINRTALFKVLIKNGLDEFAGKDKLVFCFDKKQNMDKGVYKAKNVRLDPQQYEQMEHICNCTPFSMSSLAKYFIMPQINEIVEKKGWSYKP